MREKTGSRILIGGEEGIDGGIGLVQNFIPQVFHSLENLNYFLLVKWRWRVHNIQ